MRLMTLNGAPLCAQLDFSEEALLNPEDRDQAYTGFLRRVLTSQRNGEEEEEEDSTRVKWRHLTNNSTRLHTGWSQPFLPAGGIYEQTPDFSFSIPIIGRSFDAVGQDSRIDDSTYLEDTTIGVGDFLEHSLLLHDTLLSSRIAIDAGAEPTISFSSFPSTSFDTALTETSSPIKGEDHSAIPHVPSNLAVVSLNSLPSPRQLRLIYPQTPTRNLVCVLTSQPEHREVVVRKGNYRMQIYEILVADDTKSEFKVSFWFRPPKQDDRTRDQGQETLRTTLELARVGDILLLRNVVLAIFRDQVFGQSLNASIARARTTVEVLKRGNGLSSTHLSALPAAVVETFVRVKRWANVHVVPDQVNFRKRKGATEKKGHPSKRPLMGSMPGNETLPPDTMET